jgi:hypothetical protein
MFARGKKLDAGAVLLAVQQGRFDGPTGSLFPRSRHGRLRWNRAALTSLGFFVKGERSS